MTQVTVARAALGYGAYVKFKGAIPMARLPIFTLVLAMAGALCGADPAAAQATRTWVSGVGDDVNPCSRTAPCKTFAGAISKTAAGGEINCLDPGGFGTLTITKSITVDCTGTMGSTLNSGGINGFVVNDSLSATPRTSKVVLRGLSINGAGTTPGLNGIRFISGASLVVENVFILNQTSGSGINIAPSLGTARIVINNTQVRNSGSASGAGLAVVPTGSGGATVSVTNSSFDNNSNGILASVAGTTGQVLVDVANSSMSNNTANGLSITGGAGSVNVMATRLNASGNGSTGMIETGSNSFIRIGSSTVTGNNVGVSGNNVFSFGNNHIIGNTTNGTTDVAVLN